METSLPGVQNLLPLPSPLVPVPLRRIVGRHGNAPPSGSGLLHPNVCVQIVVELLVSDPRLRHHVGGVVVVLLNCY